MNNVIKKEKSILQLLDRKDPFALKAFEDLLIRFARDDHLRPTIHPVLLDAIYIERTDEDRWKLTVKGHIGDTTCSRYRNMYIKHFFYFYEKNKALAEAAASGL